MTFCVACREDFKRRPTVLFSAAVEEPDQLVADLAMVHKGQTADRMVGAGLEVDRRIGVDLEVARIAAAEGEAFAAGSAFAEVRSYAFEEEVALAGAGDPPVLAAAGTADCRPSASAEVYS